MTDLTRYTPELSTLELGNVLVKSGYFADTREASQAIVKVLAGREMGIGPIAAMTGIYIVKGRVTLSANLMAAQIKRSGRYNYIVRSMTDIGCSIEFFDNGQSIGFSDFDEADAKAAGLLGGENWKKFPRNMYFARAISNGAKWFCPDVFSGPVYTPDELGSAPAGASYVDTASGEIIEQLRPEPAPQPTRRDAIILRINDLTLEANELDLEIITAKTLVEMSDDELIQHGKNLRAAIDQAKEAVKA